VFAGSSKVVAWKGTQKIRCQRAGPGREKRRSERETGEYKKRYSKDKKKHATRRKLGLEDQ